MSEQKVMNRWLVVVGAILIQLCLGAIYAWSVFTPTLTAKLPVEVVDVYHAGQLGLTEAALDEMSAELELPREEIKHLSNQLKSEPDSARQEDIKGRIRTVTEKTGATVTRFVGSKRIEQLTYGFNKTQSQAVFAVGLALFAIVMVLAGRMMPKFGPRKVAMLGGIVLGLGYLLAGLFGNHSFVAHLIFIGVVGGAGIGLAYVVPIAVAMRWFPDKKGLVAGLAVAGFGFGALLWVKLAGAWGALIANMGLPATFMIYGAVFTGTVLIGSIWMAFPPEGWKPSGWSPPQSAAGAPPAAGSVDFKSGQMLRTPQYYMILLTFIFGASAGLMSIGLMKLFPIKALVAHGLDASAASAVAGTAMAVFFSLANGLGRIAWGAVSDKLGRKTSIIIMMATQGIFVILFQWMADTPWLLFVGATLIGFNFGGNFALFPAITADTFGNKYVGQNYGWVFLAYGIGGIFGPILGGRLGDLNNFPLAFTICGVLCLVAAGIIMLVGQPKAKLRAQ